ncbi:MBL fold metallo-hydrolase [Rhodopila sp.]|jgi:glyoxylase-like metal-dependent hydrolase (beta-lactamase superfamily II)|uniref:MBL fold metallo-hydrolase n=1 Tax=Rhodopila sp. TaxID=2480087 RepID=UPI002D1BC4E5|nr:MBL fold metallo-hydrolase [Rhodopila sp.]HVZ10111.1 MBL fold metallo-hydrolase [Rhodopila sp.]
MQHDPVSGLDFPFTQPPAPGELIVVADGLRWMRLPLPYRLDHVNIYLIRADRGWVALDTGLGTDDCRRGWDTAFAGPLKQDGLSSLIVSHFHPDHVGLANWLVERCGIELTMPRPEYLHSLVLQHAPADFGNDVFRPFYRRHGLAPDVTEIVLSRGHEYLRRTTGVPPSYHRIKHNDAVTIGGRTFQVRTGGGHALEQAMLYRPEDRLFLAADQVIARISPNVSVHPMEPTLDALGIYLASLRDIRATVNEDVLVLPGHGLPFYGLHRRIDALIEHHGLRCGEIEAACRTAPLSVAEILPFVFTRELDAHQTGFAFGEVLAHVNHMLAEGRLRLEADAAGVDRYRTV